MASEGTDPRIDEYISGFDGEVKARLELMRATIREAAPEAVETMSYGIPTFDLKKKHLVHFGGYAKHVGFYPTPAGIEAFAEELSAFEGAKGSVKFPLDEPLPLDLVRRITVTRVAQVEGRT